MPITGVLGCFSKKLSFWLQFEPLRRQWIKKYNHNTSHFLEIEMTRFFSLPPCTWNPQKYLDQIYWTIIHPFSYKNFTLKVTASFTTKFPNLEKILDRPKIELWPLIKRSDNQIFYLYFDLFWGALSVGHLKNTDNLSTMAFIDVHR